MYELALNRYPIQVQTLEAELEHLCSQESLQQSYIDRIVADACKAESDSKSLQSRMLQSAKDLEASRCRIEELRAILGVSKEELGKWTQELESQLNAEEEMKQFTALDSGEVQDLRRRLQTLTDERDRELEKLRAEEAELQEGRFALDGELSSLKEREAHRADLSGELEARISLINQADAELSALAFDYSRRKGEEAYKKAQVNALVAQIDSVAKEKSQYSRMITAVDRELELLNPQISSLTQELAERNQDLSLCLLTEKSRMKARDMARFQLDRMIKSVEVSRMELNRIQSEILTDSDRKLSLSDTLSNRESEIAEARSVIEDLLKVIGDSELKLSEAKGELVFESSRISELNEGIQLHCSEINRIQSDLKQSRARQNVLFEECETIKSRVIALEFELDRGRLKIESLQGRVTSSDEKDRLVARLKEMEERHRETKAVEQSLSNEVRRQEVALKSKLRKKDELVSLLSHRQQRESELEMEIQSIVRQLESLRDEKKHILMARDELLAQLGTKKHELGSNVVKFTDLQNRKTELDNSQAVYRLETDAHIQKLLEQNKQLHESKHAVGMKLGELRSKISQLRTKYDHHLRDRIGTKDDDSHSQTTLVMKAAEERRALMAHAERLAQELEESQLELNTIECACRSMRQTDELEALQERFESSLTGLSEEETKNRKIAFVNGNVACLKSLIEKPWFNAL